MLESSVWQLSKEARLLWLTMLLKKDRDQIVRASIPGLAHVARLDLKETEIALKELAAPDKYSHSKEHDGRRVLEVPDGWFIVNGAKYREQMSHEERKEYNKMKQREYRNRARTIRNEAIKAGATQAVNDELAKAQKEINEQNKADGLPTNL